MEAVETTKLPLYSALAIRIFSFLFSPIAGGLMLAQNFRDVGRPDAARKVIWGTIGIVAVAIVLLSALPGRQVGGSGFNVAFGIGGGIALNAYFDRIVENKELFPAKKIWKPLLICLAVFTPLLIGLFYALSVD
ncbi:hypothetical protein GCM10027346_29190 [Hymenobacter seoulensis]